MFTQKPVIFGTKNSLLVYTFHKFEIFSVLNGFWRYEMQFRLKKSCCGRLVPQLNRKVFFSEIVRLWPLCKKNTLHLRLTSVFVCIRDKKVALIAFLTSKVCTDARLRVQTTPCLLKNDWLQGFSLSNSPRVPKNYFFAQILVSQSFWCKNMHSQKYWIIYGRAFVFQDG